MESQVTLGILAGGRASRLGGRDKAWLTRDRKPQVVRIASQFGVDCRATLVSANSGVERFAGFQLRAVPDRIAEAGPLGGIEALSAACETAWLFTLPVDIVETNACMLRLLMQVGGEGAVAEDDDGVQPLVALYRVDTLRDAVAMSIRSGDYSVQAMQQRLQFARVRFAGMRFGNLNTPADLLAAGIDP